MRTMPCFILAFAGCAAAPPAGPPPTEGLLNVVVDVAGME
jgi:hypothetical protein